MARNSKDKFKDSLGLIKSTLEWAEKQDVTLRSGNYVTLV